LQANSLPAGQQRGAVLAVALLMLLDALGNLSLMVLQRARAFLSYSSCVIRHYRVAI
jgi:hypothetical protein